MRPLSLAAAAATVLLAACAHQAPSSQPPLADQLKTTALGPYTFLQGYLPRDAFVDDLALLPAPPAPGTAAMAADEEAYRTLTALQNTPRGALARQDANLDFPAAASTFSCALGVNISEQTTPNLYTLLYRSMTDAGRSSSKSKKHYERTRPFVYFKEQTCLSQDDHFLRGNGSYPSGHTIVGWTWALELTQLAPDRADALLQRGRAFGQSRAICGAHWKTDVESGRLLGAVAFAKLQGNAEYRQQLALARDEVARARTAGQVPPADQCAAETRAIQSSATSAP